MKTKICTNCKKEKPTSEFGVQNDRKSGRRSACKDCDAITQKKRRKENPGELKLSLAVDHNHDSGNIRQLLCNHCNLILGLVQDNISLLEEFIKYVQKHENI